LNTTAKIVTNKEIVMLVSDQYKFIFIHIPKVAGTSVQHGLNESICNPWELANWRIEWFLRRINSYLIPLSNQKVCLANPLDNEKSNIIKNPKKTMTRL
jgi:hypothetical protein